MQRKISILISNALESLKNNKISEAKNFTKKALVLDNSNFEALNLMGTILGIQNYHSEAKIFFEKLVKLNPKNTFSNFNLARTLSELNEDFEATIYYKKAIELDKSYHDALCGYGMSLFKLNKFTEALEKYNSALNIDPNSIVCLINKAILLNKINKNKEAIVCCDEVLKINKSVYEAWHNKIIYLLELELNEEAISCFEEGKRLKIIDTTKDYGIFLKLAQIYYKLGLHFDSEINCKTALKINPNSSEIKYNLALSQLISGNFLEGFKNYEHRFNLPSLNLYGFKKDDPESFYLLKYLKYSESIPKLTNLSHLRGKTLLIVNEQGYGDFIQFSRFIYKLLEYNPKQIIVEVYKNLQDFIKFQFNSSVKIVDIGFLIKDKIDFVITLPSLPFLFKTTINSIPYSNKYFSVSRILSSKWKKILKNNKKINIGIACSGNIENKNNNSRSIALEKFEPLKKFANLFLLQNAINNNDQKFLNSKQSLIKFIGKDINLFDDLAAVIENMDLVISIDTVFTHLAGALGKKTYLILASYHDWRWLIDINYSPWYDSLTIYRRKKNENNWDRVFSDITKDLENIKK